MLTVAFYSLFRVALFTFVFLLFSAGMFHASISNLPSSLSMYGGSTVSTPPSLCLPVAIRLVAVARN